MSQSICKIAPAVFPALAVSEAYALFSEAKAQRYTLHEHQLIGEWSEPTYSRVNRSVFLYDVWDQHCTYHNVICTNFTL